MLFYVRSTERRPADPQEERALLSLQRQSLDWLDRVSDDARVRYAFRGENNASTHLFLNTPNHLDLHEFIDADPLASYAAVDVEPLLTPVEMAQALERYLGKNVLAPADWEGLAFPPARIDPSATYLLARKVVAPFSPLLDRATQDIIHHNTLVSQTAHSDDREIADFNPVGKPVGILIMRADSVEEVLEHVSNCEVYVDSKVTVERLLTLLQARQHLERSAERLLVGGFRTAHRTEG